MAHFVTLQGCIEQAIRQPDFTASLQPLSDDMWRKILTGTPAAKDENERLEFLGDALMYATLGRQLFQQVPNGTPHLYTVRLYGLLRSN